MTTTTNLDSALAEALRRIGTDRSARRIATLGGGKALMAACGCDETTRGALHLRAWLRAHP